MQQQVVIMTLTALASATAGNGGVAAPFPLFLLVRLVSCLQSSPSLRKKEQALLPSVIFSGAVSGLLLLLQITHFGRRLREVLIGYFRNQVRTRAAFALLSSPYIYGGKGAACSLALLRCDGRSVARGFPIS